MAVRPAAGVAMAAFAAVVVLMLAAGCAPRAPTREPPAGTPAAVDPLPARMAEVTAGFDFAFAVPQEWEHCPGHECYGDGRATVWAHGDSRLVVPRVSGGWWCPSRAERSTMALSSDASRHLPDAYDAEGERSMRVEVPIVDGRELAVAYAQGAWQHEIVDRDGVSHLVNKVLSGQVLTMYFLYLDEETVAQVTGTVAVAVLDDPWTPGSGHCRAPDGDA